MRDKVLQPFLIVCTIDVKIYNSGSDKGDTVYNLDYLKRMQRRFLTKVKNVIVENATSNVKMQLLPSLSILLNLV